MPRHTSRMHSPPFSWGLFFFHRSFTNTNGGKISQQPPRIVMEAPSSRLQRARSCLLFVRDKVSALSSLGVLPWKFKRQVVSYPEQLRGTSCKVPRNERRSTYSVREMVIHTVPLPTHAPGFGLVPAPHRGAIVCTTTTLQVQHLPGSCRWWSSGQIATVLSPVRCLNSARWAEQLGNLEFARISSIEGRRAFGPSA